MRGTIPRFAVVPTHNRPDELKKLVTQLSEQCDGVVVVDNASTPPVFARELHDAAGWNLNITVIRDAEQPPNLSRLWNVGLNAVKITMDLIGEDLYDVAIFNDDAVLPDDWWDQVSRHMRFSNAAVACRPLNSHVLGGPTMKTEPDGDIMRRLCGWAFMMRGELGLRVDERFRWWYGDTDLDWQARKVGGTLLVPGDQVGNTRANQSTVGVLAEQAGHDRQTFIEKWGWAPW